MIRNLVAINGSPSPSSRTAALAAGAVQLNQNEGTTIHLGELDADALLARGRAADVDAALDRIRAADAMVLATPVYRGTYSGLLKALFDLFEENAFAGIPAVLTVTAGGIADSLCIDHGLRPLVASLGGWSMPTAVVATHSDFEGGRPGDAILARLGRALAEAELLAGRGARRLDPPCR